MTDYTDMEQLLTDPLTRRYLGERNLVVCPPDADWHYWHVLDKNTGGITPICLERLRQFIESIDGAK